MAPNRPRTADLPRHRLIDRRASFACAAAAILAYAVAAYLVYRPLGFVDSSHLPSCACGDLPQEVWFTAWMPYAIGHLQDPFFTTALNYPSGVNMLVQASFMLLSLVIAPITLLWGPVASYVLLLHLAYISSAASLFFVLLRFVRYRTSAFMGGLLYGFSPYMIAQGEGHLSLTFVALPPVMLLLVYDLLFDQRYRAKRAGTCLGLVVIAQFFISIEVLVTTLLLLGILTICVIGRRLWRNRQRDRDSLLHLGQGVGVGVAIAIVALAFPTWFALDGPQHLTGPVQATTILTALRTDLLGAIYPTLGQLLAPNSLRAHGSSLIALHVGEGGAYLGLPLIALLVVFAYMARKMRPVRVAVALALCSYVLSLGTRLIVDGHSTGLLLPFDLIEHLPGGDNVIAMRLSLYMYLFAAVVLAVGLDTVHARFRTSSASHLELVGVTALSIAAFLSLIPVPDHGAYAIDTPHYFSTAAFKDEVPPGGVVLTYPYPIYPVDQQMLWQAISEMRFSLIGDAAYTPGPRGVTYSGPPLLAPIETVELLTDAWPMSYFGLPKPPPTSATITSIREFARRYHVSAVLAEHAGKDPATVIAMFTAAFGPPREHGELAVWKLSGS